MAEDPGAAENNLKQVNVDVPLGIMTAVTGVSGSGKSSLINEVLYKTLARDLNRARVIPGKHKEIQGLDQLDKVISIDQSPIGRTPRSNPATYTGVLIRSVICLHLQLMPKHVAIRKDVSVLMSKADAAKPAVVMVSSRLRCISLQMFMYHVKSAKANDITVRHWK